MSIQNGIYHVSFKSPHGHGEGTVYLENGILRGGDAIVAYFGDYQIQNNHLTAQVNLKQHGTGSSIFGNATHITCKGQFAGDVIQGEVQSNGITVGQLKMNKVLNL